MIADSLALNYAALADPYCQLKVVGKPFAMSGPSFAAKKGSGRVELLLPALRSLPEGLQTFIEKNWVTKYSCQKQARPVQLPFKDLSGLFLQLLIAIALCILGTSLHVLWSHSKQTSSDYGRQNRRGTDTEENQDLDGFDELETNFRETPIWATFTAFKSSGQTVLPTQANSSRVARSKLAPAGRQMIPTSRTSPQVNHSTVWIRPRTHTTITKTTWREFELAEVAKRWKTWLDLGENLSLIKFKTTRSNSSQVAGWPNDTQLHRSCELGSRWFELGGPFGQGFRNGSEG